MKRIIFLILTALAMNGFVKAQSPYYYRTGDTIVGRSPIYFYQWWSDSWLADTNHRLTGARVSESEPQNFMYFPCGEILQYCYTETPLNIIGIATSCAPNSSFGGDYGENPSWQEYVRLYEAYENDFVLLKEVPYSYSTPVRYMDIKYRGVPHGLNENNRDEFFCCEHPAQNENFLYPIREYYFDKPVTVYDSFYVGHTTESFCLEFHPELPTAHWWYMSGYSIGWFKYRNNCSNPCEYTPFQLHKYRHLTKDTDPNSSTYGDTLDKNWHWTPSRLFMLQFPIVVIDSSYIIPPYECPPVESPRVGDQGDGQAILLWDTHTDHNSWQISYGPQGTEPDDGTIVNCPIQVGRIDGLDTCTHYTAYVRAVCNHDSICYSQWSEPVDIYLCDTTGGGGGDPSSVTSALSLLTNIIPNPASTFATVYSSFQLTALEAYDLRGNKVLDTKASGASATIDIADWPSGMYIVIVHTPAGNVAKKLVVN